MWHLWDACPRDRSDILPLIYLSVLGRDKLCVSAVLREFHGIPVLLYLVMPLAVDPTPFLNISAIPRPLPHLSQSGMVHVGIPNVDISNVGGGDTRSLGNAVIRCGQTQLLCKLLCRASEQAGAFRTSPMRKCELLIDDCGAGIEVVTDYKGHPWKVKNYKFQKVGGCVSLWNSVS
jgi:hypothetical protein